MQVARKRDYEGSVCVCVGGGGKRRGVEEKGVMDVGGKEMVGEKWRQSKRGYEVEERGKRGKREEREGWEEGRRRAGVRRRERGRERERESERGMEENDGRRRRRRRRGRSRGQAGAQSVRSQEESAAAAGQWTVSTAAPNGHRAVSDTLEYKVRLTGRGEAAHRASDGLREKKKKKKSKIQPAFERCRLSVKDERLQEGSDAAQRSRQTPSSRACRPPASGSETGR